MTHYYRLQAIIAPVNQHAEAAHLHFVAFCVHSLSALSKSHTGSNCSLAHDWFSSLTITTAIPAAATVSGIITAAGGKIHWQMSPTDTSSFSSAAENASVVFPFAHFRPLQAKQRWK